jgi:hypothetical protein
MLAMLGDESTAGRQGKHRTRAGKLRRAYQTKHLAVPSSFRAASHSSVLCSRVSTERRRRAIVPMCLCMPLHASARLHAVVVGCIHHSPRASVSLRHAPCGLIVGVMRVPRNTRMKASLQTVMTKRYRACCCREGDEEKCKETNLITKAAQRVDEATSMR